MARREIEVLEADTVRASEPDGTRGEERTARLVALGKALSGPIQVQMLGVLASAMIEGRGCCDLPDCGNAEEDQDVGICVCEFEGYYGMGQSKVSYHLGKLKEAAPRTKNLPFGHAAHIAPHCYYRHRARRT